MTGLEFEGYHWYEVEKEVVTGRNKKGKPVMSKQRVWYVYAFYSMDRNTYNTQLKVALQKIVREGGFTKEEATLIASRGLGLWTKRTAQKRSSNRKSSGSSRRCDLPGNGSRWEFNRPMLTSRLIR